MKAVAPVRSKSLSPSTVVIVTIPPTVESVTIAVLSFPAVIAIVVPTVANVRASALSPLAAAIVTDPVMSLVLPASGPATVRLLFPAFKPASNVALPITLPIVMLAVLLPARPTSFPASIVRAPPMLLSWTEPNPSTAPRTSKVLSVPAVCVRAPISLIVTSALLYPVVAVISTAPVTLLSVITPRTLAPRIVKSLLIPAFISTNPPIVLGSIASVFEPVSAVCVTLPLTIESVMVASLSTLACIKMVPDAARLNAIKLLPAFESNVTVPKMLLTLAPTPVTVSLLSPIAPSALRSTLPLTSLPAMI